ncbi:MAG TPA: glycosyltransferase, partial [Acidobacteriota bacterium]|nr:glycosyltransferase [Acidobacteriota bacterium]
STGVGVYLQNLAGALAVLDRANEYHLFSSSWKERYSPPVYGPNFHVHDRRWPVSVLNYSWNHWQFPSIESLTGCKLDVAHSPGPLMMPARHARKVITVHDLYFYAHPEQTSREIRRDYASMVRRHCEQTDAIIAVSEYTRKQLTDWLNIPSARICTIRHGADPFFAESVPPERLERIRAKYNLQAPFYIFVGGREPRKNMPALLEAFAALEPGAQLVLAGPRTAEMGNAPGIVETG